jgi:REP element-mobilizing transposase RayT
MAETSTTGPTGTRRTRVGRRSIESQVYHIVARTALGRPVFADLFAARQLVLAIRRQHDAGFASTLAFVVMPDHLHWLMQIHRVRSLSAVVKSVKAESARNCHRLTGEKGAFWQQGFYDRAIRRDDDLLTVARYIVANPLRGGLVSSLREYPHWYSCWLR